MFSLLLWNLNPFSTVHILFHNFFLLIFFYNFSCKGYYLQFFYIMLEWKSYNLFIFLKSYLEMFFLLRNVLEIRHLEVGPMSLNFLHYIKIYGSIGVGRRVSGIWV